MRSLIHTLTPAFSPANVALHFYLVLISLAFLFHPRSPLSLCLSLMLTHSHTHFLSNHFIPYCLLSLHSHFFPLNFHSLLSRFSRSRFLQLAITFFHPCTALFLLLFPFGQSVSDLSVRCPCLNLWLGFPFFFLSLFEPITILPAPSFYIFSLTSFPLSALVSLFHSRHFIYPSD